MRLTINGLRPGLAEGVWGNDPRIPNLRTNREHCLKASLPYK